MSSGGISQGHAPWPSRENWDGVFEPRALRKMAMPHDAATSTIFGAWFAAATRGSGDVFFKKLGHVSFISQFLDLMVVCGFKLLKFCPRHHPSPWLNQPTVYIEPTASGSGVLERITYSDILD